MVSKKAKGILLTTLLIVILTAGLVFYFNYELKLARQDYGSKIEGLGQKLSSDIKSTRKDLSDQARAIGENLSLQINSVNTDLSVFKDQNQKELDTLSKLLEQIEKQSNIKLNELKDDFNNLRIKSADFSGIVDGVLQSVVSIGTNQGQGSGAIIDRKGYIVTNVHVINGASSIKATTYSGKTYSADTIIGYDGSADIAVLKINAQDLKALNFGDSDVLKVGEKVIAAGNPAGLSFTVTEGIVSAFRTAPNGIKYIQTDVPINPGNSGGPLINAKGEIVGINNFKVSASGFEGLGFAISSNEVRKVVGRIISDYESKN